MIKKIPLKLSISLLVAMVLLWATIARISTGNEPENSAKQVATTGHLVSAIQPLSDANVAQIDNADGVISGNFQAVNALNEPQNTQLNDLFKRALKEEDITEAIKQYQKIIELFPTSVEPHLNLASLYANNAELEKARVILMHGFEHNPKANLLFSSLQELHGALAASAYSKALDTNSTDLKSVNLPSVDSLVTSLDQERQVAALKQQLLSLDKPVESLDQNIRDSQVVEPLGSELRALRAEMDAVKKVHAQELLNLNREIAILNQSSSLVASGETDELQVQNNHQSAISLVHSWAKQWSAQNVDAYVAYYAQNYTSSSSLTRSQWLSQRQQRFADKAFIEVIVSDFIVKDLDGQFSVTFKQNYKSDSVDDTVTKRLIFNKNDGDWASAKIVNESTVTL